MHKDITRTYTNGDVTVIWKRDLCKHSTLCFRGLPQVFDPGKRPWVSASGASTQAIVDQVNRCPSGALSYVMNDDLVTNHGVVLAEQSVPTGATVKVDVLRSGPLLVHGDLVVTHGDGTDKKRSGVTAFCRCGASSHKPYCDGSHASIDFKD